MKLALLLPGFAPNLYDLACALQADKVVLIDNEPWSRKSRVHRALIRTPDGTQYINIPVRTDDRNKPVNRVRIDHSSDWLTPLLRSIAFNYRNALYFDFYEPEITADFKLAGEYEYLLPFTLYLRYRLFRFLDLSLKEKESQASKIDKYDPDPDKFAKAMKASALYQEHDSRHYMRQAGMKSEPKFSHSEYHQHFEGFKPWCCAFDLLFQMGPESFRVLDRLK
ncbi:MAG: WbqC family protein [Balneolaceae bacterium]